MTTNKYTTPDCISQRLVRNVIRIRTLQNVQHLVVNMSIRSERVKHVQVVVLSTRAASATSSLLNQQTSCRYVPLYISTHHLAHRMKTQVPVARQTTRSHPRQIQRSASDVANATLNSEEKEYFSAYSLIASTPRSIALRTGST